MRIEPEMGGCSIVLVGNFNPAIFAPQWFARWDIVSQKECDEASVSIIHPEIVEFQVGSKVIHVEQERFSAQTSEAPWITLCDLVVKTFRELLPHTPASKVGINRFVHFSVGSEEARNQIGRALAPIEPWGEWGKLIGEGREDLRGGFATLTMQQNWKQEGFRGHIQAQVEPSKRLTGRAGIYMHVNHHAEAIGAKPEDGCDRIISYLGTEFERSIQHSEWIIDQVMKLKEGGI
jgi:hypothetical protein